MSPSTSQPTILDKTMLKPKEFPNNQDQPKTKPSPTSYKQPRDNENNPTTPPRVK